MGNRRAFRRVLSIIAALAASLCVGLAAEALTDFDLDIELIDRCGSAITVVVVNDSGIYFTGEIVITAGLAYNTSWVPEWATIFLEQSFGVLTFEPQDIAILTFVLPDPPLVQLDAFVERRDVVWTGYEDFDPLCDYVGLDVIAGGREHAFAFLPLWPGVACCNGDGPFCEDFDDALGRPWDPTGGTIQEIADCTVGIAVSTEKKHGGRPYYQMMLGTNSRELAQLTACHFGAFGVEDNRRNWCSETISYWHREAGIPYARGLRNDTWLLDWQIDSCGKLRRFYQTEELLPSGRGRWIDGAELDYEDFQPGVNAPCPGAYVLIARYDPEEYDTTLEQCGSFVEFNESSHSQMIDTMTIYRNPDGSVACASATLLEGNSGSPARVRDDGEYADLLCATALGASGACDNANSDEERKLKKRIVGFGIDLDEDGNPIYDKSRLLYEDVQPGQCPCVQTKSREPAKDDDDVPKLVAFAQDAMKHGFRISSEPAIPGLTGIPSGLESSHWELPQTFEETVITIDLLNVHPYSIETIMLQWGNQGFPTDFEVLWSGSDVADPSDDAFQPAILPWFLISSDCGDVQWDPQVPIPAQLAKKGSDVRHIRLRFPSGIPHGMKLLELRVLHD